MCAAGGEAGAALAAPYSKGFMVLWSEHYSVQNRVKTLKKWCLGGCVETIAQNFKITAMKKCGEALIKTGSVSAAAGSLLLYLNVFQPLYSDDISFSQEIFFFPAVLVSVQINDL